MGLAADRAVEGRDPRTGIMSGTAARPAAARRIITVRRLLRRPDANRNQRGVGWACLGTAGCPSFTEELRLIAGWSAIRRHQNFVVLALHSAPRYAIRLDNPHARARRTRLTLRPRRTGRAGRTCRSRRTDITFGALRSRGTRIPLRTFAATGQANRHARQQRRCQCQMRCTHLQILLGLYETAAPPCPGQKIKLGRLVQGRCGGTQRRISSEWSKCRPDCGTPRRARSAEYRR
jgi:hypothetical protein